MSIIYIDPNSGDISFTPKAGFTPTETGFLVPAAEEAAAEANPIDAGTPTGTVQSTNLAAPSGDQSTIDAIMASFTARKIDANQAMALLAQAGVSSTDAEKLLSDTGLFVPISEPAPPTGAPVTGAPVPATGVTTAQPTSVQPISPEEAETQERIRQSQTLGGRLGQFGGFTQRLLGDQGISPTFRGAIDRQFNPLSAAFSLQGAQQGGEQNFRDFLGGAPSPLSQPNFLSQLQNLSPLFAQGGTGPTSFAQGGTLAEQQRGFLGGNTGENIATQFLTNQIAPLLRRGLGQNIGRRFQALGDINPLIDPFTQFIRREFQF